MNSTLRIAVVGATGLVGREILSALSDSGHPSEQITALASDRSAGEELEYGGETLEVEHATAESFRGIAVAFFAAPPEVARALAPKANAGGTWVVDLSSAFRLDPDVPLVHQAVNLEAARSPRRGRIVSSPSATTCILAAVVEPLRSLGVESVLTTVLLGAANLGSRGARELEVGAASLLSGRESDRKVFPHRAAFNLIPQVGSFAAGGWTTEEVGWNSEASRIWSGVANPPRISGTAVQVPIFHGELLTLEAAVNEAVTVARIQDALKDAVGVKLLDAPQDGVYPMPMLAALDSTVHVGRIRVAPGTTPECFLVAAADGVRLAVANAMAIGDVVTAEPH